MQYRIIKTTWGYFGFVTRNNKLVATYLPESKSAIQKRINKNFPDATESKNLNPKFARQIINYYDGKQVRFTVDIEVKNKTVFQQNVLQQCRKIPFGLTASYGDLARAAGNPGAARAVGTTMAGNTMPLIIPCHRVVKSDGSIGGFSSPQGILQKEKMLKLENPANLKLTLHKRKRNQSRKKKLRAAS